MNEDAQKEAEENEEQPQLDPKKVMEELEKLKATNQRLLDESVQYKTKYKGLRDELESKEKQKLEDQENHKELYDMERKKRSEIEDQLYSYRKKALQKDMHFKVASKASDAYDVEDVIRVLPKDMLQIDEDSESVNGIDEALSWVKENKPYLFKQNRSTGMSDSRPVASSGRKSWNDYSKDEKDAAFKNSLKEWL